MPGLGMCESHTNNVGPTVCTVDCMLVHVCMQSSQPVLMVFVILQICCAARV